MPAKQKLSPGEWRQDEEKQPRDAQMRSSVAEFQSTAKGLTGQFRNDLADAVAECGEGCDPGILIEKVANNASRLEQKLALAGLDLHLIVDNYGTHKHPRVQSWLRRHPRFFWHFIPTSSSWLNMVERWFREITDKRLRRGTFDSERTLIKAIMDYIDNHNQNPKAFVWTASAEAIMRKIRINKEALESRH